MDSSPSDHHQQALHQAFASATGVPNPMAVHSTGSVPNPLESILLESEVACSSLVTQSAGEEETSTAATNNNKRTALAGQWRTPPTPFFPNGGDNNNNSRDFINEATTTSSLHYQQQPPPPPPCLVVTTTAQAPTATIKTEITISGETTPPIKELPHSTEAYAKALQEAYRRGAEAAARAAAQQQLVTVSSNPDLQQQHQPSQLLHQLSSSSLQQQGSAGGQSMLMMPSTTISSSVVPVAAPSAPPPQAMMHQQQQQQFQPAVIPELVTSSTSMPPPALMVTVPAILPAPPTNTATQQQQQQQQQQQRSVSMPDMASYAAQQEDEKRQKRLARNRASARLRRMRKKNLVDAYETEVVALEKTIKQLQNHQWGNSSDPSALLEALSMDRGQQQLTAVERTETAHGILTQQLQFLQQLEDIMQEHHVLYTVARETANGTLETSEWAEVGASLQLTPDQCQSLLKESVGWDEEWHALQTIKTSLQALKENKWLWNEGCSAITDQFMAILHKNQISKFLLWADHNAEAIEELDAVHAVDKVTDSPVFQFGVDNNPNELLDDEKPSAAY